MERDSLYDMTRGNPTVLLLKFSLPMIVGNIFQQFYNMVDAMVVGRFVGANALAAVGSTGSISFLFFSLAMGLSAGIGIIVSQYFGAKDEEQMRKTIATSAYVILISALLMGMVTIMAARPMMMLLHTPDEIIEDAVLYLRVTGIGMLAVGAFNGISSILRALGDAKTPLMFLAVACMINIILDLAFVVVFGLGVLGVALATIISQVIAGAGGIVYAWIKMPLFRMPLHEYKVDHLIYKKCLVLGIPVALQNSLIAISCLALQGVVNEFGATIMAAFTVASRFEQLVQQPFNSLGAAVATFTGQNMGAHNTKRIKRGFWAAVRICIVFCFFMLPVAWLGGEGIMRLFTSEADVIREGARGIRITSIFYTALGLIYITRNVLNGSGDVKFAMVSGVVEVVGRVGLAKPLTLVPAIGMLSIWFTTGLTWTITGIIGCLRYASGKWKTKGIVKDISNTGTEERILTEDKQESVYEVRINTHP